MAQKRPSKSDRSAPDRPTRSGRRSDEARDDELGFPIVGVGASAGGLEAFIELFEALPADTGMGFVLVPHLAPTHESALAEILSRTTSMPIQEVADESVVEPNRNRQVRTMTRLIEDLLDVARITQGKIELRKTAIDVNRVLQRAVELVQPQVD